MKETRKPAEICRSWLQLTCQNLTGVDITKALSLEREAQELFAKALEPIPHHVLHDARHRGVEPINPNARAYARALELQEEAKVLYKGARMEAGAELWRRWTGHADATVMAWLKKSRQYDLWTREPQLRVGPPVWALYILHGLSTGNLRGEPPAQPFRHLMTAMNVTAKDLADALGLDIKAIYREPDHSPRWWACAFLLGRGVPVPAHFKTDWRFT